MLQIYRRHLKSCSHTSRSYRRCPCPIWVQGARFGGETIRRAMDVTSIEAASNLVAQWNAAGAIGAVKQEPARVDNSSRSALASSTTPRQFYESDCQG